MGDITVGELKAVLCDLPHEREVLICADLEGEWMSGLPGLDERAVVFGYYTVDKVCADDEVILMTGEEVLL